MISKEVNLYTDGSFDGKNAKWAYIIIETKTDKILHQNKGVLDGEINQMYQIGGEIFAVQEGLKYCLSHGYKSHIYYDYTGLYNWVSDYFDKSLRPWKTKKIFTKEYRAFIKKHLYQIFDFNKVKSHSGDKYNEMVDVLAAS